VGRWAIYRAVAAEGYAWVELGVQGQEGRQGYRVRLHEFPHAEPAAAASAIEAWVEEIEKKLGLTVETQFQDYRLNVTADGPRDSVRAAEHFMMAGFTQHEAGNLDVLTIVISSEGEVLFKGVSDYVVGAVAQVYVAPGVEADW